MDPYIEFARRGSEVFPVLAYDPRFVYHTDSYRPSFLLSTEFNPKVYAAPELLAMLEEEKSSYFVPDTKRVDNKTGATVDEKIVFERANPFIKIPSIVAGAEKLALQRLFNFVGTKVVVYPQRRHIKQVLDECILVQAPPNNLLIGLPNATNNLWMHFVYLLTKLYGSVTLLQLAMSDVRHVIAMGFRGIPPGWEEEMRKVSTFQDSKELTSIFKAVPTCFSNWFTFMNNIHLSKVIEIHILNAAQKSALDADGIYTSMPSYDIKRVIALITGQPVIQEGVRSSSFKFLDNLDEEFVRGLHLYGEPENMTGIPLHTTIDIQKDLTVPYAKSRKVNKGGIHWGQRKLCNEEVNFFTRNLAKNETAVAIYIGAAPFDHGPILLDFFPNLKLVLIDPSDTWNEKVRQESRKQNPRIHIENAWATEDFAKQMLTDTPVKGAKNYYALIQKSDKVFFLSDIRSVSPFEVGHVDNEVKVDEDMRLQSNIAQWFATLVQQAGKKFMASFKFRLPYIEEIGGADYAYLGGSLHTQTWSRDKSTELRLWWSPEDPPQTYNKKRIEDIMMYHNTVLREASFGAPGMPGYCECHDCHYELDILKTYINTHLNVTDLKMEDILAQHVKIYDGVFGMTLTEHADRSRMKAKVFRLQKIGRSEVLRYNPLRETIISDYMFERRNFCVKTMKAVPKFKEVSEESLQKVFSTSLLCEYYGHGKYFGLIDSDICEEITGIKPSQALVESLHVSGKQAEKKLDETLKALPVGATAEVFASKLDSAAEFYKVTTRSEDRGVSTMSFHKSLVRRFLMGIERKYDMSLSELRREPRVMAKVYCLLKRLGPAWNDHLAYSLDEFYDAHPELEGSLQVGGCLLSARQHSEQDFSSIFAVLVLDLELGFGTNVSILQLKHLVVPERVITIFAPPVRCIWLQYFNKSLDILNKYSKEDKAVVMIIPSKYIQNIPAELQAFEHRESRFEGSLQVHDTMKNKAVDLRDMAVLVFRTKDSSFTMSY
jgi:hypothetical protein